MVRAVTDSASPVQHVVNGLVGRLVNQLVLRVSTVSFNPVPFHFMVGHQLIELDPQVLVFHWLPGGRPPAVLLPALDPAGDALAHILGVCGEAHPAASGQGRQCLDGGHQFHPVVGGLRLRTFDEFFRFAIAQQRRPAPRTRITTTGAICINLNQGPESPSGGRIQENLSSQRPNPSAPNNHAPKEDAPTQHDPCPGTRQYGH